MEDITVEKWFVERGISEKHIITKSEKNVEKPLQIGILKDISLSVFPFAEAIVKYAAYGEKCC